MPVSRQRRALMDDSRSDAAGSHHATRTPAGTIEAQLSANGEPVLGLYLHIAYHHVMSSFAGMVGRREVTPAIIGLLAMLAEHPGVSQAKLARLMGLERATVGTTVARAITAGFVVRQDADARSYTLSLSPRGERMLRTLRRRIAAHESAAGSHLTVEERRTLRSLLNKLVYGA